MITLYHAASDTTVTLPNPQLGDGEQRVVKSNVHKTMSGAYITTISRTNKYKFTLSFNILTRSQVDALEALIEEHGSSGLLYTDYLGAEWNVILEAHVVEYTEGSSFYTARLDLQGEPA